MNGGRHYEARLRQHTWSVPSLYKTLIASEARSSRVLAYPLHSFTSWKSLSSRREETMAAVVRGCDGVTSSSLWPLLACSYRDLALDGMKFRTRSIW